MSKALTAYLTEPKTSLIVQLLAAVAAFWPVWVWYCERTVDRSDEPLGVVALLTVIALVYLRKTPVKFAQVSSENVCSSLALLLSLVLLYCVIVPWAPPVVLALVAISVVAICLFRAKVFGQPLAGDCVLMLLSIPLVASLNFYLGYPMRLIASFLAACMLNLGGLAVSAQGAEIVCNSSIVGIDQPCSGIKMLWVALYLAATLSSLFRFSPLKTINMMVAALALAIVANAIRVSSLFYIETKIIDVGPDWHGIVHSGIGVAAFALLAALLLVASTCLMRGRTSKDDREHRSAGPEHESKVPARLSTVLKHSPAVPVCMSAVPEHAPAVPEHTPAVPQSAPAVPECVSTVLEHAPAVPVSVSVVPQCAPTVPERASSASKRVSTIPSNAQIFRLPKFPNSQSLFLISFASACFIAACIPFLTKPATQEHVANSILWPDKFEGQKLTAVPLSQFNLRFADGFPGRIAVFRTASSRIVFRVVTQPTRQLHASESCYKASGYRIKWMPELIDSDNKKWTVFEAVKGTEKLYVRERYFDEHGNSWIDVSSWYWAAVLKQTQGPWWAVSVAQRVEAN